MARAPHDRRHRARLRGDHGNRQALVLQAGCGRRFPLSAYQVKTESYTLGGQPWRIRSLLDRDQFDDPTGTALACGIPEAHWSFFGQVWASGLLLADEMSAFALDGKRTLEIGCGLALGGLVSHARRADVMVSDIHPLCEPFLLQNLLLNGLPPLRYRALDWRREHAHLGRFDVIVASDVLYELPNSDDLVRFIEQHAALVAEVVVTDPGRGAQGRFSRAMIALGFELTRRKPAGLGRLRVLTYRRGHSPLVGGRAEEPRTS